MLLPDLDYLFDDLMFDGRFPTQWSWLTGISDGGDWCRTADDPSYPVRRSYRMANRSCSIVEPWVSLCLVFVSVLRSI